MRTWTSRGIAGAALAALLATAPGTAHRAAAVERYGDIFMMASGTDEQRKSNLAGRQLMFAERMVALACAAHVGADAAHSLEHLNQVRAYFEGTQKALRDGNPALGLAPETNERLRDAFAEAEQAYAGFAAALNSSLAGGEVTLEELRMMDGHISALDRALRRVLRLEEAVNLQGAVGLRSIVAFNFVNDQRAEAQQIVKDLCLSAAGLDADVKSVQLAQEVELFESRMRALRDGEPLIGLAPAPSETIRVTIDEILAIWDELQPFAAHVIRDRTAEVDEIPRIMERSTPLLSKLSRLVFLYEALD